MNLDELGRLLPQLAGPSPIATGAARLLETGIKVIDVMCPLVAGGNAIIAGELCNPTYTLYELRHRLKDGPDGLKLFALLQEWRDAPPGFSFPASLKEEGLADIPCGAVQQFFMRAQDGPWTASRLSLLDPFDVVIRHSRDLARARVFPAVDVVMSRSRLFQTNAVSAEHVAVAERVRKAIAALWSAELHAEGGADARMLERALKLQNYFARPFSLPSAGISVPARRSALRRRCRPAAIFWTGNTTICPPMRSISAATWARSEATSDGRSSLAPSRCRSGHSEGTVDLRRDVRNGSFASFRTCRRYVRSTPNSGHFRTSSAGALNDNLQL